MTISAQDAGKLAKKIEKALTDVEASVALGDLPGAAEGLKVLHRRLRRAKLAGIGHFGGGFEIESGPDNKPDEN